MRIIPYEYKTSNSFSSLPFNIVKRDYILKNHIKKAITKNVKLSPKGFYVIQLEQFKQELKL